MCAIFVFVFFSVFGRECACVRRRSRRVNVFVDSNFVVNVNVAAAVDVAVDAFALTTALGGARRVASCLLVSHFAIATRITERKREHEKDSGAAAAAPSS